MTSRKFMTLALAFLFFSSVSLRASEVAVPPIDTPTVAEQKLNTALDNLTKELGKAEQAAHAASSEQSRHERANVLHEGNHSATMAAMGAAPQEKPQEAAVAPTAEPVPPVHATHEKHHAPVMPVATEHPVKEHATDPAHGAEHEHTQHAPVEQNTPAVPAETEVPVVPTEQTVPSTPTAPTNTPLLPQQSVPAENPMG